MPNEPFVLKDVYFSLNAVDYSDHVQQIQVDYSSASVDRTAMTCDSVRRLGGLKDAKFNVTLLQDFAAGEPGANLFALVGTVVAMEIRATSDAASATNPKYTCNVLVASYPFLGGRVGDLATTNVRLEADGDVTEATS